jgi:hypothetical protein
LDSLKWIIVAGFVALFLLGLIFVSRQPQSAAAPAVAAESKPVATARPKRAATAAQAEAESPSVSRASSNLDREVRGSLDELKDVLFRLELRREAGTITDADYVRERDRVHTALRGLVKG